MAVEIRVPPLGESLVDAVVGVWLKQEGDSVSRGESLVELETDKVNLDVTAEDDGVLSSITRQAGEVVTVGDVLGLVSSSNGASAPSPAAAAEAPVAQPAPAARGASHQRPRRLLLPRLLRRHQQSSRLRRMEMVGDVPRPQSGVSRKSTTSISTRLLAPDPAAA